MLHFWSNLPLPVISTVFHWHVQSYIIFISGSRWQESTEFRQGPKIYHFPGTYLQSGFHNLYIFLLRDSLLFPWTLSLFTVTVALTHKAYTLHDSHAFSNNVWLKIYKIMYVFSCITTSVVHAMCKLKEVMNEISSGSKWFTILRAVVSWKFESLVQTISVDATLLLTSSGQYSSSPVWSHLCSSDCSPQLQSKMLL
jgi:hypothetical protein